MKNKKIFVMISMLLLMLSSVLADISIVTNETTNIGTERFTITTEVNESSLISYSVSQDGTEILRNTFTSNDTSSIIIVSDLIGNTNYDFQVNYTSHGNTLVIENSVTTDNYLLRGIVRVLLSLFALVFAVAFIVKIVDIDGGITKETVKTMIGVIIMLIIIIAFINGALAN